MTAATTLAPDVVPMAPLACPPHLTTDTRVEFRTQVLDALDAATAMGAPAVELFLGAVVDIDASGLGVLILLQKRARERNMRVRLHAVPSPVERLFEETRMGPLFDIVRSN